MSRDHSAFFAAPQASLPPGAESLRKVLVLAVPPRQRPYDQALQMGFEVLCRQPPSPAKLIALGATMTAGRMRLPAEDRVVAAELLLDTLAENP